MLLVFEWNTSHWGSFGCIGHILWNEIFINQFHSCLFHIIIIIIHLKFSVWFLVHIYLTNLHLVWSWVKQLLSALEMKNLAQFQSRQFIPYNRIHMNTCKTVIYLWRKSYSMCSAWTSVEFLLYLSTWATCADPNQFETGSIHKNYLITVMTVRQVQPNFS